MLEWEDIHFSDEGYSNADQKKCLYLKYWFFTIDKEKEKDLFGLLLKPLKDSD